MYLKHHFENMIKKRDFQTSGTNYGYREVLICTFSYSAFWLPNIFCGPVL